MKLPRWIWPVALTGAICLVISIWNPRVLDLAAHVFRIELFEDQGFGIWNGSWYGGHYTLTYSLLFPPLGSLLGTRMVGALAALASAYLFDRLVAEQWGDRTRLASLWFALGAGAIFANSTITFLLGLAFGLAALRVLQLDQPWPAAALALLTALASPVAAVFLGGVAIVIAVADFTRRPWAIWMTIACLGPVLGLNLIFHEEGQMPFSFAAFLPVALFCAAALFLTRKLPGERGLRIGIIGYALATTLIFLIGNPLGSNVARLAWFAGGPLLLAVLMAHGREWRAASAGLARGFAVVVAFVTLAWGAYWQLDNAISAVIAAEGDPSTEFAYYKPIREFLSSEGAGEERIEIPESRNRWENAFMAPDYMLARGWLRQMDRARNPLFYEGELTAARYHAWLTSNGVSWVAVSEAEPQENSEAEVELILGGLPFLKERFSDADWKVYKVADATPLARSNDGGVGQVVSLNAESMTLDVTQPGAFRVLLRSSPYWEIVEGAGCVGSNGAWTTVRADQPGILRLENRFSLRAAWNSLTRDDRKCGG